MKGTSILFLTFVEGVASNLCILNDNKDRAHFKEYFEKDMVKSMISYNS